MLGHRNCSNLSEARAVVFDEVHDAMQAAVNGAFMVVFAAKVLTGRLFLIFCNVNGMVDEFGYAFVFSR